MSKDNWHESTDAAVWAEQFVAHKEKLEWSLDSIDEGLMLAWFASAMMSVNDKARREHE